MPVDDDEDIVESWVHDNAPNALRVIYRLQSEKEVGELVANLSDRQQETLIKMALAVFKPDVWMTQLDKVKPDWYVNLKSPADQQKIKAEQHNLSMAEERARLLIKVAYLEKTEEANTEALAALEYWLSLLQQNATDTKREKPSSNKFIATELN